MKLDTQNRPVYHVTICFADTRVETRITCSACYASKLATDHLGAGGRYFLWAIGDALGKKMNET